MFYKREIYYRQFAGVCQPGGEGETGRLPAVNSGGGRSRNGAETNSGSEDRGLVGNSLNEDKGLAADGIARAQIPGRILIGGSRKMNGIDPPAGCDRLR